MKQLILFNKPYGVLSQFTHPNQDKTLADFIQLPGFYPAGRLDKKSEGLLLLTNNGRLQHQLSHPRFNKKKYYWVQVEGIPEESDLKPLKQGLVYDHIQYLPASAKRIKEPALWERIPPIRKRNTIPTSWLEIILTEGKYHQVRKMTAAIGFPTLRLVRHRIGPWKIGSLQPGAYQLIALKPDFNL